MKRHYIKKLAILLILSATQAYAAQNEGPINIHISSIASYPNQSLGLNVTLQSNVSGCGYIWAGYTDTDVTINQVSTDTSQFCAPQQFTGQFTIYASTHQYPHAPQNVAVCTVTYDSADPAIVTAITPNANKFYQCHSEGLVVVPGHGDAPIPLIDVYRTAYAD